ncbi:MAG TPA: response regulator [Desulfuromonadaceae bacterium]
MEGDKPLSILLVEDDGAAREILASVLVLKFPQIVFHVADNGKTGLECFDKHASAIVITDVNMPVMDGLRMARGIKSIMADVKMIVLTAFSDKSILETTAADGIGIDHYILKPVDYEKLFAVIEQCLAEVATGHGRITPKWRDNEKAQ